VPDRISVAGQTIPNSIWIGNTNGQTIEVRDADTGDVLRSLPTGQWFAPRNIAIMENGEVFTSAGDPGLQEGTISAYVMDASGKPIREYDLNRLGWLKSTCPVVGPDPHIICASQDEDKIHRINVGGFPEEIVWTARTGKTPRGLVMDRDEDIWVSCKVGNTGQLTGGLAEMYVHNGVTGAVKFGVPVPHGIRGIVVDSNNVGWACCLGDQPSGNGNLVVQVSKVTQTVRNQIRVGSGPFAICIDTDDNKYVACSVSSEIWKIDADGVPVEDSNWPFDTTLLDSSALGPIQVTLDGLQRLWVGFKTSPYVARLSREDASIQLNINTPANGKPETLGDWSGYYRAMVLSPTADSDGDGVANLVELQNGTNPFNRFSS